MNRICSVREIIRNFNIRWPSIFSNGRGFTISEITLVSSRNPLTGQYLDRYRDLFSGPNPIHIAVNGERTRLSSLDGAAAPSIAQTAQPEVQPLLLSQL